MTDGTPRVLVADDDAATRYLIGEALRAQGFDVVEAASGDAALALGARVRPDLFLLDVEMPVRDGYSVCRALRERCGASAPPVVMVTSHDDRESIDRAYDAGATDFISKPISWPLLGHRLRYILRGARNTQALNATLEENRALMAALPDHLFVVGRGGEIIEHLQGQSAAPTPDSGRCLSRLLPAASRAALRCGIEAAIDSGEHSCLEYREACGRWRECRIVDHGDGLALAILRDVSERKSAEARIHPLAYYHALTGLPNRSHFVENAGRALREASPVALFLLDIDRFKRVNDTLGTGTGDLALQEVAARLSACARELLGPGADAGELDYLLACFGGNTFAVMLTGNLDTIDLADLSRRFGRAIARPMRLGGHEFVLTASIGLAVGPEHGRTLEVLLRNAEAARVHARSEGSNAQRIYRTSMNADTADYLGLENDLRHAIENDDLEVYYQPKYAAGGVLAGAEALLRWPHPVRGSVAPGVFVRLAEECGLMDDLGRWVMRRVCQQIAAWRYCGLQPGPIAVNVSGREFATGRPAETATDAVRGAGIDAAALEIEITETVLMSDIRSVVASLHELRDAGFRLAVDDFGTGYSSLRYLQRFPIDVLKIDSSFVRHVETNADSRAICTAIIALARSLRLEVVGEGVATPWQEAFLRRERCDVLQGFLLGRPAPAACFEKLLAPVPRAARPRALSVVR